MNPIKKFYFSILTILLLVLFIPNFDINIPENYKIKNIRIEPILADYRYSYTNTLETNLNATGCEYEPLNNIERVYVMETTGYTKECGYPWDDGITSIGTAAKVGRTVAVDPNVIPLGTELTIEGFDGVFVAEDIGSAVKDYVIDIYFGEGAEARKKALSWGRREVRVIVVE